MSGTFMPLEGEEGVARAWFHRLANARENPAALAEAREWLVLLLAEVPMELAPSEIPAFRQGWENITASDVSAIVPATASAAVFNFHAPLALLEGAWLQALAQPANHAEQAVAELFAAYLALLGPDEATSPACAYRLASVGGSPTTALGPSTSWRFAQNPQIGEPALRFASLQLALGQHAAHFFPETLGFTLAYLHSASPWRLPALPPPRRREVLQTMAQHAESALQAFFADGGDLTRLPRGYALYQTAEAVYLAELKHFANQPHALAEQVGELFRRKRRFARGYHKGVKLGGRGLEEWFAESPFDAAGFLSAFATSHYVVGEPGQRPFDRLTAFGGPMFGVFDWAELALISAWLGQAQTKTEHRQATGLSIPAPFSQADAESAPAGILCHSKLDAGIQPQRCEQPTKALCKQDQRTLFHALINQDSTPETHAAARHYVEKILAKSRRAISPKGPLKKQFFDYDPLSFAQRIAQIHDEEIAKYKPFQAPPKLRREEYLWGIRQFAPAILVDGSWLRHQGEAANQDSRLHRLLYRIYAEELGEGRMEWNHPRIYSDLLNGLGIELPAIESEAFAQHLGFMDSAFDLPSYLLAISLFPRTYLPETLGLNLAIELSGLGAGYVRLSEELQYWNIDPLIVKLHLSIDNLAGGHAAMACEAIQIYLDEARRLGGDTAIIEMWRRIWSGYLSLDSAVSRFKWALILNFCRKFLPGRLLP